jgi:hypothetical protein
MVEYHCVPLRSVLAFELFRCAHSSSISQASFPIALIGPCRSVLYHLNFFRIFSHRCVPIRLRHVHLRFVFSALRLPCISSAIDTVASALALSSISSVGCTHLRYLRHYTSRLRPYGLQQAPPHSISGPTASFGIAAL